MEDRLIGWRKSSHSGHDGADCVELADLGVSVGVRDSKAPEAGHLVVDRVSLASLVRAVKAS
ncbi:DUF397 domain-containing protein [Actinomadura parmotrematis]|uniref:DUF397 domain-containing protein n=1 Tax=Actinomadura parmotrematis TaxID=2864039 RepID=A0ABS7FM38_9ACTN|nr:DUF397 domain-containing protein [Actinomadura parmotrematis]MBW8481445.1 DUF397 domain-containing protein [Actinomadura parmotrematis]